MALEEAIIWGREEGAGLLPRDYHYCCYLVAVANPQVHQLNDPEVWHAAYCRFLMNFE